MGLDITAHRQIKPFEHPNAGDPDFDGYEYGATRAYLNPDFPGRADDVVDRALYTSADQHGFRAGSYGGYNDWREWLAKLAGYLPSPASLDERHRYSSGAWAASGGPFWELINFADNEGTIGAAVSAKLAKDFADHQAKADAYEGPDADWCRATYADWRKAFEMAADGGMVEFH